MNTTVNTATRRMTIPGYNFYLESLHKREAKEKNAKEAKEQISIEELLTASQANITLLNKSITNSYTSMLKDGKDMKQSQDELKEKTTEEELFHKTADDVYSYKELDESVEGKMSLRRFAYYALPTLDCFFAFFALYPIVTSKIIDISSVSPIIAIFVGTVLSVLVGLGVSLISRLGVSSLSNEDKSSPLTGIKKMGIAGSVLALPLMYIIGEVAFNGGTQWTYSGCFAFISLMIQILIVTGYSRQMEALEYFREREHIDSVKRIRKTDENSLNQELFSIRERIQNILTAFGQHYASFIEQFQSLAAARDEHLRKFGKEPNNYLNQMIIYFGDLICFRYERIPLNYEEDGKVSSVPFIDFPYAPGVRNIFLNDDYLILDYMMKYVPSSISMSETLRIIEEQRQKELSSSSSNPEPTPAEPTEPSSLPTDTDDGPIWE